MSKAEQKKFKEQMLRVQMNRISNEQQRKNFESALILILWVLHDKFGFGQQRLTKVASHENLLLGTSTWGAGEMQDDWYDGVKTSPDHPHD